MTIHLDAAALTQTLPYPDLAAALLRMFDAARDDVATAPPRSHLDMPGGGVLLLMPAFAQDFTALKTVTVHASNAAEGRLPVVQGEVLLMDTRTGERLATMAGAALTARRTAALSVAGVQRLARPKSDNLLLIGAGVQAAAQARAFIDACGVTRLWVHTRSNAAQALCESLRAEYPGLQCEAVDAAQMARIAADEADLIVTATTSTTPVLPANVKAHTIVAVGAYRPDMAEVPPELVRQCRLVVDILPGAAHEAGDLMQAGVDWATVIDLPHATAQSVAPTEQVLLKTVGHALWDLATAQLAWERQGR